MERRGHAVKLHFFAQGPRLLGSVFYLTSKISLLCNLYHCRGPIPVKTNITMANLKFISLRAENNGPADTGWIQQQGIITMGRRGSFGSSQRSTRNSHLHLCPPPQITTSHFPSSQLNISYHVILFSLRRYLPIFG